MSSHQIAKRHCVPWPEPPSPQQSPWRWPQDEPSSPAWSQGGTYRGSCQHPSGDKRQDYDTLVQELEKLGRGVLVESVRELSDGRGNLEALAEDDLLALKANILGPLDKAGEVLDGLDVLACERPQTHINI